MLPQNFSFSYCCVRARVHYILRTYEETASSHVSRSKKEGWFWGVCVAYPQLHTHREVEEIETE